MKVILYVAKITRKFHDRAPLSDALFVSDWMSIVVHVNNMVLHKMLSCSVACQPFRRSLNHLQNHTVTFQLFVEQKARAIIPREDNILNRSDRLLRFRC